MDKWLENFARTAFTRSSDTAHDLKTPLNVAVLNLELMRMRIRKGACEEDEKVTGYAQAIEIELRRMARIFDTFFVLSTPPKGEGAPDRVDISAILIEAAAESGFGVASSERAEVLAHESRIRQAFLLLFEGAAKILVPDGRQVEISREDGRYDVIVSGSAAVADFELTKVFKFYHTDQAGNPDLSLAAVRLIAETYGGQLNATQESDKVWLRLSLPPG